MSDERSAARAAALAALPGMGPATLGELLRSWTPDEAWERVAAGAVPGPLGRRRSGAGAGPGPGRDGGRASGDRLDLGPEAPIPRAARAWADLARHAEPDGWWARRRAAGIEVTWLGRPEYPRALVEDPLPPAVLFWRGELAWLDRPCVAVVGTRRASPDGRAVASELGRDLAEAGVCVVSGLALGIDGAAHRGALRGAAAEGWAGPVGVAASGVDVPYPRRHADLWEALVAAGAVLSETPPGRPPHAWRFPARNRIIAGLSRLVVVVESHASGGSLITADAAIARGIEVRAVPGPVHSPASQGTNQLLYDGPGPVRSATDVLDALGIFRPSTRPGRQGSRRSAPASRPPDPRSPDPGAPCRTDRHGLGRRAGVSDPPGAVEARRLDQPTRAVLEAVGWRPTSLNRIVERTGISPAAAAVALDRLAEAGLVRDDGAWWVRCFSDNLA